MWDFLCGFFAGAFLSVLVTYSFPPCFENAGVFVGIIFMILGLLLSLVADLKLTPKKNNAFFIIACGALCGLCRAKNILVLIVGIFYCFFKTNRQKLLCVALILSAALGMLSAIYFPQNAAARLILSSIALYDVCGEIAPDNASLGRLVGAALGFIGVIAIAL